jgi:hypothetical protein
MDFVSHGKMHVPDDAVRHFIDRGYREGAPFQWARELYRNSQEAGATRIEFGIEKQAAANLGVFRRVELDDGHGMDDEHIVTFYKMLGVGSKPIGGPHENFAIGAKVSLLPWNAHGVVVISRRDGVDSMIWARRDKEGDYGLREWEIEDDDGGLTLSPVVEPYDDPDHGCDWREILPDWVGEHGTAVVLLGNSADQHTVDGDPRYPEEAQARGLDKYLSARLWTIDDNVTLTVIAKEDLTERPKGRRESRDAVLGKRGDSLVGGHPRRVLGLEALLTGDVTETGSVPVDEYGTLVYYALRSEDAPSISDRLPTTQSFTAFEYDGELYEHETHTARFRMFGVAHESVRKRLWLIIKPPQYDPATGTGVYPNQARSKLIWRGNGLPVSEWAHTFAKNMPLAIQAALNVAYASDASDSSTIEDDKERRERLGARFGNRWRAVRYVINRLTGTLRVDRTDGQLPRRPRKPSDKKKKHGTSGKGGSGTGGPATLGTPNPDGSEVAAERRVAVDLPRPKWMPASAFGDESWSAARWMPDEGDSGVVQLNQDHPLFVSEFQQWQSTRANHLADEVRRVVMSVYGDLAVAHVAHVRNFTGARVQEAVISADHVDDMLSPSALTCGLSGLLGAEAMIQTRLGGRFGRAA